MCINVFVTPEQNLSFYFHHPLHLYLLKKKSSEKRGSKNPEKIISILDQWRRVIQTGISSIAWTPRVSLRRRSSEKTGTNQPPNNKSKQKALMVFLTASACFKSQFERTKPTLKRICTLACHNRVSSQHPTHSLQSVIWEGNLIFLFSLHINTIFRW